MITTTDKVYKNNNKRKTFIETDKLGGSDPYSTSKAALEIICDYYLDIAKKSKFFSLCVARSGNVIGGGIGLRIGCFQIYSDLFTIKKFL